jgi:hypothetical protein
LCGSVTRIAFERTTVQQWTASEGAGLARIVLAVSVIAERAKGGHDEQPE